jgi:hypothetical protein
MNIFFTYILLCIVFILILSVIYFIFISYEFRVNIDGFALSQIEGFEPAPQINTLDISNSGIVTLTGYVNQIDKEFNGFNKEIKNSNTSRDNIRNINIYDNVKQNELNSRTIKEMNENLRPIISKDFPIDKFIKTIKSKYNSQYLSTYSNDNKNYNILANDKCLTVRGLCKTDFCLLNCQNKLYTSNSQHFTSERINNNKDAAVIMNVPTETISTDNIYPYSIFKSLINDNCLTISNEGITVEKCNLNNIKQQWEISPNENICVLE